MSAPAPEAPRVLQDADSAGHGNRLLLYQVEGRPALLKEYRARGTRAGEWAKAVGYVLLERKRGISARDRCRLERELLALWRRHGFDVPALLAHPLPPGFRAETASWLEYCPGPTLGHYAADASQPLDLRERELARFAATLASRHARALEQRELGLVMKHASLRHVLLHAGRQVHFDFEGAHAPGMDLYEALADELSGILRSLLRPAPDAERERLFAAFLGGHTQPALLREVAARGAGGGIRRRARRWADRLRRPEFGKHETLAWVMERVR